ncbi:hypothetical protein V1517DRAFT_318481 [Lipomyces orientalis]|uniref:Uncharacterized protein n=1 Tax=Lipomyces orientalis TaxID=1233043 RepID=A0ACC3TSM8_9ASCO
MSLVWQTITEVYPPSPKFTEKDLPDLTGKVYFITGATAGIGLELLRILFWKNATVYVAARNRKLFREVTEKIMETPAVGTKAPSLGRMELIPIDLADLPSIKPGVEELLSKTKRLDSVWYNAGVMVPPEGSKTIQGYELQWGVNVVGHFLLNKYLTPTVIESAKDAPANSVRVMWVASDANNFAPSPDGINWDDVNFEKTDGSLFLKYAQSKAGDIILGYEMAKRVQGTGVLSLSLNPGHLKSNLFRSMSSWRQTLSAFFSFEPRLGALTEIFVGFSPKITTSDNGGYFVPWGRFGTPRGSILDGLTKRDTGNRLWEMLDKETEMY